MDGRGHCGARPAAGPDRRLTFDASQYADETTRAIAQSAADADVFRFDGSDLMPADVGSGTFWTGMVDWVSGQSSEDTLKAIDESWPSS